MLPTRLFAVLAFAVLAACSPRGLITTAPDAAPGATVHRIFLATNRQPVDGPRRFGSERSGELRYAHFDISVPPEHAPGAIEWPDLAPDPAKHFMTLDDVAHSPEAFERTVAAELAAQPAGTRDVVVFVHGFNNTFAEGLYRLAQIRHDFGIETPVVTYSWPSLGNPLGYVYDRDSTLFARDGLEGLLVLLERTPADRLVLIAHSLGAFMTMEVLRELAVAGHQDLLARITPVILIAPDVDVDVFRAQAERIGKLPQPFLIFASGRDRALMLSARLSGQPARLGSVETLDELEDFEITVIDTTAAEGGDGLGHLTAVTSPTAIAVLSNMDRYEAALNADQVQQGVLPGTVTLVRNATRLVLSPLGLLLPVLE